jgi:hypothetical protein
MLVDFAQQVEHSESLPAEEAIYQASMLRFRPILMTTMAALLGAVPMMLGTGVGSEIRQPLGYAIVGGLAVSQSNQAVMSAVPFLSVYWRFCARSGLSPRRSIGGFWNGDGKSLVARECVVGLRGLELRARHAVLSNQSLSLPQCCKRGRIALAQK